jgi:arylsulfatase A-like enzyme
MERTIVVLTSDHGEEFGEHGGDYHYTLYDEIVRVPLVVRAPGLAPSVRDVPAQQVDLLPTLLALLDIEPPDGLPGIDLLGPVEADRPVFIERNRPSGYKQTAIIRGDRKLVYIEEVDLSSVPESSRRNYSPVENVWPGIYLFDRSSDPKEQQSVFNEADPRSIALLSELAAYAEGIAVKTERVEVDEKTREQLRELGYLR